MTKTPSDPEAKDGYLREGDPPLFDADLYIAAMARSGSTWLSNLLTMPQSHWVWIEPRFEGGALGRAVGARCAEFGWPDDDAHWKLTGKRRCRAAYLERYRSFLAPRVNGLSRWGVKEVRNEFHLPTIKTIRPRKIIILVRDIRHVAASLLEKWVRQGCNDARGPDWVESYCAAATETLMNLQADCANKSIRTVRYEDLTNGHNALHEVSDWLDWPVHGDPFANMRTFERSYEIDRHSGTTKVTARVLPDGADGVIARIAAANHEFQRAMGYE